MSCEWLTPRQAARKLTVTTASIYRWIRKGELPYSTTPGGRIRICEGDLIRDPAGGRTSSGTTRRAGD